MRRILLVIFMFIICSCKQEKNINPKTDIVKKSSIEKPDKSTNKLTSELDSIKKLLYEYENRFKKLEYLTTGKFKDIDSEESDVYGENYRVEIYLNEIYKSIYLTRIEYFGEGGQRITSRIRIDFEKMTGTTKEQTSDLEFVKWIDFDEFEIKSGAQIYHIEIKAPDSFTISEY